MGVQGRNALTGFSLPSQRARVKGVVPLAGILGQHPESQIILEKAKLDFRAKVWSIQP